MNRDFGGDYFLGDLINSYSLGFGCMWSFPCAISAFSAQQKSNFLFLEQDFSSAQSRRDEMFIVPPDKIFRELRRSGIYFRGGATSPRFKYVAPTELAVTLSRIAINITLLRS